MKFSSALEQKKVVEKKEFGAIDYDAPVELEKKEKKSIGLGTQVNFAAFCVLTVNKCWESFFFYTTHIANPKFSWNRLE